MMSRVLVVAASAACALAITVPATNVTLTTRACQPPYDTFPFCDDTLSVAERVADLISRIHDEDIPGQLTARHNESGQSPVTDALPYIGVPEFDWGMNGAFPESVTTATLRAS